MRESAAYRTRGFIASSSDSGCPIPPAAPRTATFLAFTSTPRLLPAPLLPGPARAPAAGAMRPRALAAVRALVDALALIVTAPRPPPPRAGSSTRTRRSAPAERDTGVKTD